MIHVTITSEYALSFKKIFAAVRNIFRVCCLQKYLLQLQGNLLWLRNKLLLFLYSAFYLGTPSETVVFKRDSM